MVDIIRSQGKNMPITCILKSVILGKKQSDLSTYLWLKRKIMFLALFWYIDR